MPIALGDGFSQLQVAITRKYRIYPCQGVNLHSYDEDGTLGSANIVMGIPGILKEIGKGERIALSKLAIEHLEKHNRPLRVAIDAAIWNFQTQSGQGGKNPALRTLFFRFLRLLALPIQPVFVFDGKNKPLTKRGRTVTRYHGTCVENELSKGLVSRFSWPSHMAPGEAEAECAFLQKRGVVDMVMSQDVDAIMFGAGVTLRDWSKEGTRGNKSPTHVNLLDSKRIVEISGLDPDGMILVALLSGGDYDESGVPGFGAALACEVARAGFGKDLIDLVGKGDSQGLREWRERLQYELETNESGYFKRRHKTLKVPDTFPDLRILRYYLKPAVSKDEDLPALEASWCDAWESEVDVPALREYTASMFDWCWRSGARRFVRCFAQPLFQDRLRRGTVSPGPFSVNNISERRQHFVNDGIPELRLSVVPADIVGIDIQAEPENPEYDLDQVDDENEDALLVDDEVLVNNNGDEPQSSMLSSPLKKRRSPPWDPNTVEKWWIPDTLLQIGLPDTREEWYQLQRDIRADPKRFATRKATKSTKTIKSIDNTMQTGAIRGFFTTVSKATSRAEYLGSVDTWSEGDDVRSHRSKIATSPEEFQYEIALPDHSTPSLQASNLQNIAELGTHTSYENGPFQNSGTKQSSKLDGVRGIDRIITKKRPETSMNSSSANTVQLPLKSTKASSNLHKHQQGGRESDPNLAADTTIAGSYFPTTIETGSSPLGPPSMATEGLTADAILAKVTQRKPRRPQVRRGKLPSSTPESPGRVRRPIESFFQSSQESVVSDSCKDNTTPGTTPRQTVFPGPNTSQANKAAKSAALARDSLPGTWKDFEADSLPQKRAPRVSYVDLTSD